MGVLGVEMSIIHAKEGSEEEVEIALMKHGLTEKNKHGFGQLSKIS